MKNELSEDLPVFYDDIKELWQEINGQQKDQNWDEKYQLSCQLLNQSAIFNKQFVTVYDTLKQKVFFLSDNIKEVLGANFSKEFYQNYPILFWVKNFPTKHVWILMKASLFFRSKIQELLKKNPAEASLVWYFHNIGFTDNDHNIALRGEALEITNNGSVRLQMTTMQNINYMLKDKDVWWIEIKVNNSIYFNYSNANKKFTEGRYFSERELEILKLVSEDQSSKDIAAALFLSLHTVDTHRKNIIKKTGVKDLSHLISLLKMYKGI